MGPDRRAACEYSAQAMLIACAVLAWPGESYAGEPSKLSRKEIAAAVKSIRGRIAARKFDEAAQAARDAAKQAPDEARFLYLEAEVMVALDQDPAAKRLRERALALNPEREAPHYTAAEMLEVLGRRTLAVREWEAILDMPPDDEVYDANAYFRLGAIYAACGLYARAADMYGKGLALVQAGRAAGAGVGMMGGTQEGLRAHIKRLREKARRFPPERDTVVKDAFGDTEVRLGMALIVKDGKLVELRRALGSVQTSLTMNVQPRGFRLFDVAPVKLRYDPEKKHLVALLNKSACCKPVPFIPRRAVARIAIHSLDCCYVFEINRQTGEARQVARFEKDYKLTIRAGLKLAAADLAVTINGTPRDWGALLDGYTFDYLPEALHVVIQGKRRSGKPVKMAFNVKVAEPRIEPLTGPTGGPRPTAKPKGEGP